MKSIIKTSFFTVLLMAVFSIGFSNAYAEEAETDKTITKTENVEIAPLQCNIQSMETIAATLDLSSQASFNWMATTTLDECEEATFMRDDGTVIIVESDCDIVIIPGSN